MRHQIKSIGGELLFDCDAPDTRHALQQAVAVSTDLRGADLSWIDMRGVDLSGVDLSYADLRGVDLSGVDLSGVDLRGVDLHGANLCGANLRDAKNIPLIITGLEWPAIIDGIGNMRIGCQRHSIEEWSGFDDQIIQMMGSSALEFWNQHKVMLLAICDSYKHPSDGGAV